jgi:hypothetical protein
LQLRASWAAPHFSFTRYPFRAPAASAPIGPSGDPGISGTLGDGAGGLAAWDSADAEAEADDDSEADDDDAGSPDL